MLQPASPPRQASPAQALLSLWEGAARSTGEARKDALLGFAPGRSATVTVPQSLSRRNALLLQQRARYAGSHQVLHCASPQCGTVHEFAVDCAELAEQLQVGSEEALSQVQTLHLDGHRLSFRIPCSRDVAAVMQSCATDAGNAHDFARRLLAHCVLSYQGKDAPPGEAGPAADLAQLPPELACALSARLEQLEPSAGLSFALRCSDCDHNWSAPMDVGEVVWQALQAEAEGLLLQIDALARAYGWSEAQILALSPTRRAAYLQLLGAQT